MKSNELNTLLRRVAVKTFVEGAPSMKMVMDEGMLFGANVTVPTINRKWHLYMEMKFQLVGGEDHCIEEPEVLNALGIQQAGVIE